MENLGKHWNAAVRPLLELVLQQLTGVVVMLHIYPIKSQIHFTSEASALVLRPGSRRSPGMFLLPRKWPPAAPLQPLACDYSSHPFPSTTNTTEEGTVYLPHTGAL